MNGMDAAGFPPGPPPLPPLARAGLPPHPPTPRGAWYVVLGIVALGFAIVWYADTMANYGRADAECLKFAEKHDVHPAFHPDPDDSKLFVFSKWIKGTDVVVEIGQKSADHGGGFNSRLCVVGHGAISIPSVFEQWQYR